MLHIFRPALVVVASSTVLGLSATMVRAQPAERDVLPPEPSLARMDGNGDGIVTVVEAEAFFARGPGHGHGGANMSGKGPDEKRSSQQDKVTHGTDSSSMPPRKPPAGSGMKPPPRPADMDKNDDGVISQAEFDSVLKAMSHLPAD
ncbi:MAG: hypothetical protein ACK5II_01650 [Paracoccus sp. (in: a-proteobacteria)]